MHVSLDLYCAASQASPCIGGQAYALCSSAAPAALFPCHVHSRGEPELHGVVSIGKVVGECTAVLHGALLRQWLVPVSASGWNRCVRVVALGLLVPRILGFSAH